MTDLSNVFPYVLCAMSLIAKSFDPAYEIERRIPISHPLCSGRSVPRSSGRSTGRSCCSRVGQRSEQPDTNAADIRIYRIQLATESITGAFVLDISMPVSISLAVN
jgi:hypothetical protein